MVAIGIRTDACLDHGAIEVGDLIEAGPSIHHGPQTFVESIR